MADTLTDTTGVAARRVGSVYGAMDLLGSEAQLLAWARGLDASRPAEELLPGWMTPDSQGVLAAHLRAAEVITDGGGVEPFRLREFQETVELVPHFRAAELARVPPPKAQVVFTVPAEVRLPDEASHLRRQLVVRVADALASANAQAGRVLLAGPYWSQRGQEQLIDAFAPALELALPVTLAGAADDPGRGDLLAMRRFAGALTDRHPRGDVRALEFVPPKPGSLFHAKLALGRVGYLGSANFTGPGLGEHVEAGVPLGEADVARVWWLMDVLVETGLLREVPL